VAGVLKALDGSYRIWKLPSVNELLQPGGKHFEYDITYENGKYAPLTVMHTSGSTGLPKPITWPQAFVAAYAKQLQLSPPAGYESTDQLYEANRVFVVFPPFHVSSPTLPD
jgi:acyl-CoA synthetase (AMP-forming)/AMP-acid ligase II